MNQHHIINHALGDPIGLDAWAAACGISPHEALAFASAVLIGLTGATACLSRSSGKERVGPILIVSDAAAPSHSRAQELMLQSLSLRQIGLVAASGRYTVREIEDAFHIDGPWGPNADILASLGKRAGSENAFSELAIDLALDRDSCEADRQIKLENLLRPKFLATGTLATNLGKTANLYNRGKMLAGGAIFKLPASSRQRHQRLDDLTAIASGLEVMSKLTSRSPAIPVLVGMEGIVRAEPGDLAWIARERKDLFRVAVPLLACQPKDCGTIDFEAVDRFQNRFDRVATHLLARRRAGAGAEVGFLSQESNNEFRSRQLEFTLSLGVGSSVGVPSLATLPASMAWTLLALGGQSDLDRYAIDTAFACASEVRRQADAVLLSIDQGDQEESYLKVARKMVERLKSVGPCRRRQLVRGFNHQALSVHEPVIRGLIEAGVISEGIDGTLSVGDKPVSSLTTTRHYQTFRP